MDDTDPIAKIRAHVEKHRARGRAEFSIAGIEALLARVEPIPAPAADVERLVERINKAIDWFKTTGTHQTTVTLLGDLASALLALHSRAIEAEAKVGAELELRLNAYRERDEVNAAYDALKATVERAYGILWRDRGGMLAPAARKELLTVLTKDGQKRGIEQAIQRYGPTTEAEILESGL